jgi:hypothetical protein
MFELSSERGMKEAIDELTNLADSNGRSRTLASSSGFSFARALVNYSLVLLAPRRSARRHRILSGAWCEVI